jgi:tetratricopeptide (TPR) repeat protein
MLLALSEHKAALDLIVRGWFQLVGSYSLDRIENWLLSFPEDVQAEPTFVVKLATLFSIRGDNKQLLSYLDEWMPRLEVEKGSQVAGSLWIYSNWARLHINHDTRYQELVRSWRELLRFHGDFPLVTLAGVETVLSFAASQEMQIKQAIKHMVRCLDYAKEISQDYRLQTLCNITNFQFMTGDTDRAQATYESVIAECKRDNAYLTLPIAFANLSELLAVTGRYESSLTTISEAHAVIDESIWISREAFPREAMVGNLWQELFQVLEGQGGRKTVATPEEAAELPNDSRYLIMIRQAYLDAQDNKWANIISDATLVCRRGDIGIKAAMAIANGNCGLGSKRWPRSTGIPTPAPPQN